MFRFFTSFLLILMLATACTSKNESALTKALSVAVKEKKISRKKMEHILKEYEMLREKRPENVREYVQLIVRAIEMGGDSTHVDVARRQTVGSGAGTISI